MADMALQVVVSPLLGVIFDNLASLIAREFRLLRGVNKDLEKLSNTLFTIRDVLEDAEEKQIKDKSTRNWLRKLKDAAYDAEDLLEECELEALQLESDVGHRSCTEQVSDSFSTCFDFKQITFRRKMGKKVKDIREKFDEIAAERLKFHLSPGVAPSGAVEEVGGPSRETSSFLAEPVIYGRDDDKESIIETLLDNVSSQNNVSICPILGIGGLGKTALAQLVYNDQRVVNQFDTRIWICVSEDFGVKRITKMIIDHLSGKPCDLVDLDPMQNLLRNLLHGKKFLLVLDDVWDDSREKWNKMIYLLTCGNKGSSVIVTTRLPSVVDSITSLQTVIGPITCIINPTHNLDFLSERACWNLFKQHAFGVGNEGNPDLIEIGWEIVEKCGGVPLAVKALGGLLYSKRLETWRRVIDSEIWDLEELGENTILPALRLSYNHLTPEMRQCFAYCSMYPKDTRIYKNELIHQWMANGFIRSGATMQVEDIGDEIFNELFRRSFFQEMCETADKEKIYCKMHDLMHDLACSVMVNECSRLKTGEIKDVPKRVRHVSVTCESSDSLSTLSMYQPFFRTLYFLSSDATLTLDHMFSSFSRLKFLRVLYLQHSWNMKSLPSWIGHLKHLRYLNLGNTDIASLPTSVCDMKKLQILVLSSNERLTMLPSSIGNLKNLRCLELSATSIKELPESICWLTNLQNLDLRRCKKLKMLPREIRNMRSLRHINIKWDRASEVLKGGMPVGIGELIRLETLELFVVSEVGGAGIQELERLNQLKGELVLKGLRHVRDPSNAQKANMRSKTNISVLQLFWSDLSESDGDVDSSWQGEEDNMRRSKGVLEGLQPHLNIQELWIDWYPGVVLPSWVWDSLPKLTVLRLWEMPNVEGWSFDSDQVVLPPCLKTLFIRKCPKLRLPTKLPSSIVSLGLERCNDPSLTSVETLPHLSFLSIEAFDEETLPEAPLRSLTRLQTLGIRNCGNLKRLPTEHENIATVKKLWIRNCGKLNSMTEEGLRNLTSLEDLRISDCRSLKSLAESSSSLQHLTSLGTLSLTNCPDMEISVADFQHLANLRVLRLSMLPQLTCLPEGIQHLTRLEMLFIMKCKNLRMLPEWLQHQPPALGILEMGECHPDLHRRCEKDKGEDWHKISHLRVYNQE